MTDAFVIVASWSHDPTPPVAVFLDRTEADRFAAGCLEHTRNEPPYPTSADLPDEEFDRLEEACLAHRRQHPAGYLNAQADSFDVVPLPLSAPPIDASRAEDARLMLEAAGMLETECTDRHTYAPGRDSPFASLQAAQRAKKDAIQETALRLRRAARALATDGDDRG